MPSCPRLELLCWEFRLVWSCACGCRCLIWSARVKGVYINPVLTARDQVEITAQMVAEAKERNANRADAVVYLMRVYDVTQRAAAKALKGVYIYKGGAARVDST